MFDKNKDAKLDVQAAESVEGTEGAAGAPASAKRKSSFLKSAKVRMGLGVAAAIVVVAGAGFMVWHEQPSFCNAICHAPQDPINATYDGNSGESGVDKWGNPVEDMGDLLVVAHKENGDMVCLDCHKATMSQQITEGVLWATGNFDYPLDERTLTDLNHYVKNDDPNEFCLNDDCHNMTYEDLAKTTESYGEYNPHVTEARHQELECGDCHKAHRQSVMACSRCHDEVSIPEGWLSAEESASLTV